MQRSFVETNAMMMMYVTMTFDDNIKLLKGFPADKIHGDAVDSSA